MKDVEASAQDVEATVCANASPMCTVVTSIYNTVSTMWIIIVAVKDDPATMMTIEAFV